MQLNGKINFQNVEELTRRMSARMVTPPRFSFEIPERDAANGIYAAMKAEIAYRRGEMVLDEATRSHIEQAARWLTDPAARSGLLLLGSCGNGKTTLMRAIARLIGFVTEEVCGHSRRQTMEIITAKEIARKCQAKASGEYEGLFKEKMLGIDDLGYEPKEVMSYGMIYTPLIDLLTSRYSTQRMTIITTNLTADDLKAKYESRVYDRLKEMMDVIAFNNPSYRGL